MDAQKNQQTDEILNAILPPRYIVVLSACTGTLSVADKGEGGDQEPGPTPPPLPHLILGEKKKIAEGRKRGRASKKNAPFSSLGRDLSLALFICYRSK